MKHIAILLLAVLNVAAQLTITSTDPNGSYVWESEDGTHWTRTVAFSNETQVAIGTEPVKLFKTEARKDDEAIEWAMEGLVESGLVSGVLDITTTEWADELLGGVLNAGPDRLDAAAKAGATHVGLVHFEKSPRHVALDQAAALRMRAPANVKVVLLLVNAELGFTAKAIEVVKPDIVQFHGSETHQYLRVLKSAVDIEIWKAFGVKDAATLKNADQYLKLLSDTHVASDHELPNTGVNKDWEKALSSAFIKTPSYGTRSSTLLRIRKDGQFELVERRFDSSGTVGHDVVTGVLSSASDSNLSV